MYDPWCFNISLFESKGKGRIRTTQWHYGLCWLVPRLFTCSLPAHSPIQAVHSICKLCNSGCALKIPTILLKRYSSSPTFSAVILLNVFEMDTFKGKILTRSGGYGSAYVCTCIFSCGTIIDYLYLNILLCLHVRVII